MTTSTTTCTALNTCGKKAEPHLCQCCPEHGQEVVLVCDEHHERLILERWTCWFHGDCC